MAAADATCAVKYSDDTDVGASGIMRGPSNCFICDVGPRGISEGPTPIASCRTGVVCSDLLAEEHIDAVILADSQCCTSAFRRASSNAISVSRVES